MTRVSIQQRISTSAAEIAALRADDGGVGAVRGLRRHRARRRRDARIASMELEHYAG